MLKLPSAFGKTGSKNSGELSRGLPSECGLSADIDQLLRRIESSANFEICVLGSAQLNCLKEQKAISTMHDRFIVCETLLRKAKLITKDEEIRQAGMVPAVW